MKKKGRARKSSRKTYLIGFLGNTFEWYDFSIYAFLAVELGRLFFYSDNVQVELLKVFVLFSVTYFARPLGAIILGYLGDKINRTYPLKLSFFLMGISTLLIGLLPTYEVAGILAVILLIILRLIQGFASGGELPLCACYIYEHSLYKKRREFFTSFVMVSTVLGFLFGSLVVTFLFHIFNADQIYSWAWRIPFLMGSVLLIFLYYIRFQLMDDNTEYEKSSRPISELFRNHSGSLIKMGIFYGFQTVVFYALFVWLPTYLKVYLGLDSSDVFLLSTVSLIFLALFTLFFAYFAKQIGWRNLFLFAVLAIIIFSYPAFMLLNLKSLPIIYLVVIFFAVINGTTGGALLTLLGDTFPQKLRSLGMNLSYTIPVALFGGSTPAICSYLINSTNWLLSPVIWLIMFGLITLPFVFSIKQSGVSR